MQDDTDPSTDADPAAEPHSTDTVQFISTNSHMAEMLTASEPQLSTPEDNDFAWGWLIKISLIIVLATAIIGGGWFLVNNSVSGLGPKTLANGGYDYSFQFYKSAYITQAADGSNELKYGDKAIGGINPSTAPAVSQCQQIGSSWTEAFTVQMADKTVPVCTAKNTAYVMYFSALNHAHLFALAYKSPQTAADYPTIQIIFQSVHVSE